MQDHMNIAKGTAALVWAVQKAWTRKWSFLVAFLVVLFVVVRVFTVIGFVPNPLPQTPSTHAGDTVYTPSTIVGTASAAQADASAATSGTAAPVDGTLNMSGELPTKIVIPSVGVNTPISNPATTNVDSLDTYLLSAAVRYPT